METNDVLYPFIKDLKIEKLRFMEKNRVLGFDVIKTIAIYFIVIYHFGGVDFGQVINGYYHININKVLQVLLSAGVPLFLMVNGALVADKQWDKKQYVKKGIKWIFLAYFWMFFFYFLIYPILGLEERESLHVLLTPRAHRIYWFLFNLGLIYIVHPFIRTNKKIITFITLFLLFIPFISNLLWDFYIYFNPNISAPGWSHFGLASLYTFFYFYLGWFLKEKSLKKSYAGLLFVVSWALLIFDVIVHSNNLHLIFDGVNALFPTIGAMLLSITIFMMLKGYNSSRKLVCSYFSFIGRNTMGIYVFHMFFILILRKYALPEILPPPVAVLISALIVNLTALLAHYLNKTLIGNLLKA